MKLRIGTRGSELALAQAHELRDRIEKAASPASSKDLEIEICVISTKGDRVTDRPLSEIGGKGLFTEEIEAQLLSGEIHMAVHSSKDMPTVLPEGLELSCFLPREQANDGFLSHKADRLEDLPQGAVVGSASLRRGAQIKRLRPDIEVVNFRGNVQTRLKKLANGDVDATLLAMAGISRLGLQVHVKSVLPLDDFLPAPGQGAICVETRIGDDKTARYLNPVNDQVTKIALICERAFLAELDGSCRTPIAGHATVDGDSLNFRGMILSPDGKQFHETSLSCRIDEAAETGKNAARELREKAGTGFFESWRT